MSRVSTETHESVADWVTKLIPILVPQLKLQTVLLPGQSGAVMLGLADMGQEASTAVEHHFE